MSIYTYIYIYIIYIHLYTAQVFNNKIHNLKNAEFCGLRFYENISQFFSVNSEINLTTHTKTNITAQIYAFIKSASTCKYIA